MTEPTPYQTDRGKVHLAWLRFVHEHPEADGLPDLHRCAQLNSWLRLRGEAQVRPELFSIAVGELNRHLWHRAARI